MRAVLDYCSGGTKRDVPAGALVLHEGSKTGHLFVLLEGRLEVIKGDSVVAVLTEPGAMLGEMSVLLDQPHTATVRAAADFSRVATPLRGHAQPPLFPLRPLVHSPQFAISYYAVFMHHYDTPVNP